MLSTEQVKQIAEYMGLVSRVIGEPPRVYVKTGDRYTRSFEPLSDGVNHKVFKALVDGVNEKSCFIEIYNNLLMVKLPQWHGDNKVIFDGEFNNESICLAYIAVMESK